ncbi:MAG: alpha-amylase [Pseudonocardiales bacterium]|nr:MAG: alpha-amylase [Pseudonocardiales bacterium]
MTHAPIAAPWWETAAVYQIYPRSFADSNGDGIGDLRGIIDRLDHVADLGADAIWISPIYRSPMADFGYDISDHLDIDPIFGTLADADDLIASAHAHGLRVIFDIILGHTSDEHPWFIAAAEGRDSPFREFYTWRDGPTPGSPVGGPPNNWTAGFPAGAPAWTWHAPASQWYLHSHLPQQPDLDWSNPDVRRAQLDVLRFWLDRGVDGVRLDSIARIGKDPELRDNIPGQPDRHQNWPVVHEYLREVRAVLDSYPDRMAVGEVWLFEQDLIAPYLMADQLQLTHNFVFARLPFDPAAIGTAVADFEKLADDRVWPAWFLNNHDEPRIATRWNTATDDEALREARLRLAAVLILTLRGTPFLYQGEELGLADTNLAAGVGSDANARDPQRTPMPWKPPSLAGPGAGFTTGEPWLPVGADATTRNVDTQNRSGDSTLAFYRKLLRLRRSRQSLLTGHQSLINSPEGVLAFVRSTNSEHSLIALNFTAEMQTLHLPAPTHALSTASHLLSNHAQLAQPPMSTVSTLELRPWESVVADLTHG